MCNPAANYWPGTEKLPGENTTLTTRDGRPMEVHVSRPKGEPPYPTMLVIHDYFDPEGYYYDLADQFAAAGYLGVCPDLFHRAGKLPEQSHEAAGKRIGAIGDEQAMQDLDDTLAYLEKEGLGGSLSITGFCWGGRLAYLYAARHQETRVLVIYYGHLTAWSGADGNKPFSPLDEAGKVKARVIGSYGGGDDSIPLDQVRDMEGRLRQAGLSADLKIYDGAPHCFFRTPEWKEASDDSWNRVLGGLRQSAG